ncbi:hypothetical protein [Pseudomonas citri]|uniref:hypothetical protein n=1 Tax=Pseudomonas citri TaxID=2978349 RepID=UPI0021B5FBBB|nr:hypothetical protein [Pseudomonas citri]
MPENSGRLRHTFSVMTERKIQKVLIDAGVLLAHPDIISRIRDKQNVPVLLVEAIAVLIDCRGQPTAQGYNAERVLQQIEDGHAITEKDFPTGDSILPGDLLAAFKFDGAPAFLLKRLQFRAQTAHTRLLEVASQYGMTIVTCDDQLMSQAKANSISCHKWPPQNQPQGSSEKKAPTPDPAPLTPFAMHRAPTSAANERLAVKALPATGDVVMTSAGKPVRLTKKISQGGEGVIYETDMPSFVCKIYHAEQLTTLRRKKIKLMVTRKIDHAGICWPTEVLFNQYSEFVGYLMPCAQGKTMFSAIFIKPAFLKVFPTWGRIDLLNVCLAFLEQVRFLHGLNILLGDINAQNLLVTQDSTKLWMVDTDSFQIEGFPCPVGTENFTAPEIQGIDYRTFMRSKEHELFAIATMLFMILFPGKPPYSQQNGGSPSANIKAKNFPYRDFDDQENFSGENAPEGAWETIWNHLKKDVRIAFQRTFRDGDRISVEDWIDLLRRYRYSVAKNYYGNEVFPTTFFFIRDPVVVPCGKCNKTITASKKHVEKKAKIGHKPWCQDCHRKHRLTRMAQESYKEGQQAERKNQGRPAPILPIARPSMMPRPVPVQPIVRPQPTPQVQPIQTRSVQTPPPRPRSPTQQGSPPPAPRPHATVQSRSETGSAPRSQPYTRKRTSKVAEFFSRLWRAIFSS